VFRQQHKKMQKHAATTGLKIDLDLNFELLRNAATPR
jgi:hypothetical protein